MLMAAEWERYLRVASDAYEEEAELILGETKWQPFVAPYQEPLMAAVAAVAAARDAWLRQWLSDAITTCRETIPLYGDAPVAAAHWEGRLSAFGDMLTMLGGDDGNG